MEERKIKEITYYDQKYAAAKENADVDFEGFNPFVLSSYQFLKTYLKDICRGKRVLDYGCGNGVHSFWLADLGANVAGIDLSQNSLEVARKKALVKSMTDTTEFLAMDCEKLDFPDNSFDVIFDGGTFSSLDMSKAYPELARVLKPSGFFIGIETFGHNPFTNFKRKLNQAVGKRTSFAASHIFKKNTFQEAKRYFEKTDIYYFHPFSWILFPFLQYRAFHYILKRLEAFEKVLVRYSFFKTLSFKVVLVFSQPKKL